MLVVKTPPVIGKLVAQPIVVLIQQQRKIELIVQVRRHHVDLEFVLEAAAPVQCEAWLGV